MKKYYIITEIQLHQMTLAGTICVGSVHTEEGLKHGGGSDGSDPEQQPF